MQKNCIFLLKRAGKTHKYVLLYIYKKVYFFVNPYDFFADKKGAFTAVQSLVNALF